MLVYSIVRVCLSKERGSGSGSTLQVVKGDAEVGGLETCTADHILRWIERNDGRRVSILKDLLAHPTAVVLFAAFSAATFGYVQPMTGGDVPGVPRKSGSCCSRPAPSQRLSTLLASALVATSTPLPRRWSQP